MVWFAYTIREWGLTAGLDDQFFGLGAGGVIVQDFSWEIPSLSAIRTSSTRDFARIFRMIWPRWTFTVISLNSS